MGKSVKFWDKIAARSDPQDDGIGGSEIKTVDRTRKHLEPGDEVLDFACGTGAMTVEIAGSVKAMHAIDISSKMIEVARVKAAARQIENIDFAQATVNDAPYDNASFDVILAFNILHLLEDQKLAIQRIHELLKPGGLFISATPCLGESTLLRFLILLLSKTPLFPDVNNLKAADVEGLIEERNFQIVETEILEPNPLNYFIVARKV